jgi:hypothetical protein
MTTTHASRATDDMGGSFSVNFTLQTQRRRCRQRIASLTWTCTTAPASMRCWRPSASPPCSPARRCSPAVSLTPRYCLFEGDSLSGELVFFLTEGSMHARHALAC